MAMFKRIAENEALFKPEYARKIFHCIYRFGAGLAHSNMYLVECGGPSVMFDTGWPESTDYVLKQLEHISVDPMSVEAIIVSHPHSDHVGNIAQMKALIGCQVIAEERDAWVLETGDPVASWMGLRSSDPRMEPVAVDRKISKAETLQIGSMEFELRGEPSHTEGSMITQFTCHGKAFIMWGDLVYADGAMGYLDFHNGSNVPNYIRFLERLKRCPPDFILPGHGVWYRYSDAPINRALDRLRFYRDKPEFGNAGSTSISDTGWDPPERPIPNFF